MEACYCSDISRVFNDESVRLSSRLNCVDHSSRTMPSAKRFIPRTHIKFMQSPMLFSFLPPS